MQTPELIKPKDHRFYKNPYLVFFLLWFVFMAYYGTGDMMEATNAGAFLGFGMFLIWVVRRIFSVMKRHKGADNGNTTKASSTSK